MYVTKANNIFSEMNRNNRQAINKKHKAGNEII